MAHDPAHPGGRRQHRHTDEYGNPEPATTVGTTPTNPAGTGTGIGYGWLGGKQRATDTTGLLVMGARLYNPSTGSFTSVDPVVGGNSTAYAYPQDPINMTDLSGRFSFGDWWDDHAGEVLGAVSVVSGALAVVTPCSAVCAGIAAGAGAWNAYYDLRDHQYLDAGLDIAGAASFGLGRVLRVAHTIRQARYEDLIGKAGTRNLRHKLGRALRAASRNIANADRADNFYNGVGLVAYGAHHMNQIRNHEDVF